MKSPIIAIADDHDLLRTGLSDLLTGLGYEISISARNGSELIAGLKASASIPQVCIVDIKMPEMDGFETTKAIKERWPDMKVMIFSFETGEQIKTRAKECGADRVLFKGGDITLVEQELQVLCRQG